jgi:hypothetical protein
MRTGEKVMKRFVGRLSVLVMIGSTTLRLAACSPSGGSAGLGLGSGAQSGGGNGSGAGSNGGGGDTSASGGGDFSFGATTSSGGGSTQGGPDASCFGTAQAPERIFVDATVTDTITTYSPVALFIMLDRSGSMITGFPTGSAQSWGNVTNALTSFVTNPASAGLDVGLGLFPPLGGTGKCDGTDCQVPAVDIGPIAKTGPQILSVMQNNGPFPTNGTPTECALRGMTAECEAYSKQASEPCVAVFITDGTPDLCDGNTTNLATIVATGLTNGVKTFTLELPGVTDPNFLTQLAQAGGTNQSIDVTAGSSAIINALNTVRQKVTTEQTTHVKKVISRPLDCQWKIPPAPTGQTFDESKINVVFTPAGGAAQ